MSDKKDESIMPELFVDHPSGKRFPIFFDVDIGTFSCKIGRKHITALTLQEMRDQINAITTPKIKHDLWITEVQPPKYNMNMRFVDHHIVGQIGPNIFVSDKGKTFTAKEKVSFCMDKETRTTLRYLRRKIRASQSAYDAYLENIKRPLETLIADTVLPEMITIDEN